MKRLIVFDLDGTLAESKSSLDAEMSTLLHDLLGIIKVAVIFGGNDYPAEEAGVVSIRVKNPSESKRVIEAIVTCLDGVYETNIAYRVKWIALPVPVTFFRTPEQKKRTLLDETLLRY